MLTIFSIPKVFKGPVGVIQRNAIRSWTLLEPRPDITLFGKNEGTIEVARELGVRHIPDIASNEYGTPLLDDLFRKAEADSRTGVLCYVNADILLMSNFMRAVDLAQKQLPRSLLISRRINLYVSERLEFQPGWESEIKLRAKLGGVNEHHSCIDVFVFPKGMYPAVPSFAIGRLWFDHWLIKAVRLQNLPVIDASLIAPLYHQKHDYNYVPSSAEHAPRGKEAGRNLQLYGGVPQAYTLLDATHELTRSGVVRKARFRKPLYKIKSFFWKNFVQRTAGIRTSLGLRRKSLQKSAASTRG